MQPFHPAGKKRDFFHTVFCNVTGQSRASCVSQNHVKIASVVANVQNRCIFWNTIFADHSYFRTGNKLDQFKHKLDNTQ